MKKVIFSVAVIALLTSGAAIFFMNFDIIKKEETSRKKERASFKVCSEKDIERFNIAVENLDILELKKIKNEVASRKDQDSIFLDGSVNDKPNFKSSEWGERPALMKAQFFGFSSDAHNFDVLNSNFSDDGIGIDERLYYPVRSGFASDSLPKNKRTGDANSTNNTTGVTCQSDLSSVVYSCEVLVDIGTQIKAGSETYLRLSPIYKKANFKVEFYDGGQLVAFDGVQPVVDSTGCANDQFRRVESRIEISSGNLPVADFTLQIDGENKKLCKDFWVTNKASGFEKCS